VIRVMAMLLEGPLEVVDILAGKEGFQGHPLS
jgi:hypothetical protein